MNKSESIKQIGAALLIFDAEVSKISKTAENPFFKNKYAPLPEILAAVKEPLQKAGLTVKQFPDGEHEITTLIIHPSSGEWLESTYKMRPAKDDPQGEGSRITYQRRYALGACLGLNIDEDDDGNRASKPEKEDTDLRPWLSEKNCELILGRMRTGEFGELGNIDDFVKKVFETYKINKAYKEKIQLEIQAVKEGHI